MLIRDYHKLQCITIIQIIDSGHGLLLGLSLEQEKVIRNYYDDELEEIKFCEYLEGILCS